MNTAQKIIGAAIELDRDDFRKRLIAQAEMHDDQALAYGRNPNMARAKQGAESQRDACLAVYGHVASGDVNAICGKCGTMVIALNIAAKMLGLSPAARTQAAVAWDDSNKGD